MFYNYWIGCFEKCDQWGKYLQFSGLSLYELILNSSVSSVDTERSFKTQGLLYNQLRSRLETSKLNEEMKIIINQNANENFESRSDRIQSSFSKSCDIFKIYHSSKVDEEKLIEENDKRDDPRKKPFLRNNLVNRVYAQENRSRTQDLTNRYVKKSRVWINIEKEPDSVGPRSQRRVGVSKQVSYIGMDNNEDSE